jgi:hypothetical protein
MLQTIITLDENESEENWMNGLTSITLRPTRAMGKDISTGYFISPFILLRLRGPEVSQGDHVRIGVCSGVMTLDHQML